MRYRLSCLIIVLMLSTFTPIRGQNPSCTESFKILQPLNLADNFAPLNTTYNRVMAWYTDSRCILVGSTNGLWLVDIDYPEIPLMLVDSSKSSAVTHLAVNPKDSSIAFSVTQNAVVYLISTDGTTSTLQVVQPVVTDLAFSPDGTLIAVASSKNDQEGWGFYDAQVQIWDLATHKQTAFFAADTGAITGIFFARDNQYLLTDGYRSGYEGDDIGYWDIRTESLIWTYDDLFRGIKKWSADDPLLVTMAFMNGNRVALGGLGSYNDYDDFNGYSIHLWDAEHQERISEIVVNSRDYSDDMNRLAAVTFNSDASVLASANVNGVIRLWKMPDGSKLDEFDMESTPIYQISYSPDDQFLAILSDDKVTIWDMMQTKEYASFALPQQLPTN